MTNAPLRQPQPRSVILVQFKYGLTPTYRRYTNWTSDYVGAHDSATYLAVPKLDVKLPTYTGGVKEGEARIELPRDTFADRVSDGYPHAPVEVKVWEEVTGPALAADAQTLHLFVGKMTKGIRNPSGKTGRVAIEAKNAKALLSVSMGLPCEDRCPWTFGDVYTCDVPGTIGLSALKKTGTLTTITSRTVVITGLPARADRYWDAGFVELDDCRIKIREWISGTSFILTDEPRSSDFLGATVTVAPGCNKTIARCRTWSNEQQFGGIGYGIPSYHPLIEKK